METRYLPKYEGVEKMEEVPRMGHFRNMEMHEKKHSYDKEVGWSPQADIGDF